MTDFEDFYKGFSGFNSVQLFSCVWLFATLWTAACQTYLSITKSQSCSNSCPLSQWCHPTTSSSVIPLSSCLQSFPASGSRSHFSHQVAKYWSFSFRISLSNEYSGLISFRIDWSLYSPRDSQESSPTPQFQSINSSAVFIVQLSHPYMTTGKTKALAWWTLVGKVMSLLFNIMSRMVIASSQGASIF